MIILLDFYGVMITTPAWKPLDFHSDGFIMFNETSVNNLNKLIAASKAKTIVLTTTHRISYSVEEWKQLLYNRGIIIDEIEKVNSVSKPAMMKSRFEEIMEWAADKSANSFIILDDDSSLNQLPEDINARWVKTDSLVGFNNNKLMEALDII